MRSPKRYGLLALWAMATMSSASKSSHMTKQAALATLKAGQTLNERPDYLAVAHPSMLESGGQVGSSEADTCCGRDATTACVSPCWVQAHRATLGVTAADGTALASKNSHNIIAGCAGPHEIKHDPTLIAFPLIAALYMLDPHSFFLAYVSSGKLVALPTPEVSTQYLRVRSQPLSFDPRTAPRSTASSARATRI
jgi:hypothetical protein